MNRQESLKETVIDGVNYASMNWKQFYEYNFELSKKVNKSGERVDMVIALAKGGMTGSRDFVDNLGITNLSSIQIRLYNGINQTNDKIEIVQDIHPSVNVKGKHVLIYDDVADTGKTLAFSKDLVMAAGAEKVSTAVICYKPRSLVVPDYHAVETTAWVVFPHEYCEFIKKAAENWSKTGIKRKEIRSRLLEIGVPRNRVDCYLPQLRLAS